MRFANLSLTTRRCLLSTLGAALLLGVVPAAHATPAPTKPEARPRPAPTKPEARPRPAPAKPPRAKAPPKHRRPAARKPPRRRGSNEMTLDELRGKPAPRRTQTRKADPKSSGAKDPKAAGPKDPKNLTFTRDEFVTTGTRTRRRIKETPVKTEVVPRTRIEQKGAANLAQALDGEVGIRVDNQCSICNTTNIKLMGMPGRYTLLLVNGIPMFSSLGTVYGFVFMSAADIRQVEVVKGASSVLYGTDAIAGVVNVITRRPGRRGGAQLVLEGGMFGYYNLAGYASARKGPFSLSLVANHTAHGKIDGDDDGISEFTGYKRTVASATGRWRPDKKTELMLRVSGLQENRQGGGMGHYLSVLNDYDPQNGTGRRLVSETILTQRLESALKFTRKFDKGVWMETVASLVYHLQDSDYEGEYYRGTQWMVYAHQIVGWKAHQKYTLLGGLTYRYESLEENIALAEYNYHIPGVFLQGEWKITRWMEFLHGFRYDWHNEFGHVFTPRANFKFTPHELLSIRAGVGTGFRAPTTFYEYAHGVRPEGYELLMNADKAETAVNANLSVTFGYRNWIKATVESSYTRVKDAITVDLTDEGNIEVFNVEKLLHVVGTEVQLASQPWKYLFLEAGWGYYHYKDDAGALVSAPPVHQIIASATFKHPRWGTTAMITGKVYSPMNLRQVYGEAYNPRPGIRGDQYLDASTAADTSSLKLNKSPWYGVVNIRVEQRITKWLNVYIGVDNLFDYTQVKKESPLMFPVGQGGAPEALDVVYLWGPARGRFVYGGIKLKI